FAPTTRRLSPNMPRLSQPIRWPRKFPIPSPNSIAAWREPLAKQAMFGGGLTGGLRDGRQRRPAPLLPDVLFGQIASEHIGEQIADPLHAVRTRLGRLCAAIRA